MKCPNCGMEMKATKKDYRYEEAGLKNVILKGISVRECRGCGEVLPEIPNIQGLHNLLAIALVKKDSPLTGEEFRFLRKKMGISAQELGDLLGVTPVSVSRWENNKEKIGPQSDRLIRCLYAVKSLPSLRLVRLSTHPPEFFERLKLIMVSIADKTPKPVHVELNKKNWESAELSL